MALLYDLPTDTTGIIDLGQWIATTTPVFWPLTLSAAAIIFFIASFRSNSNVPKSALGTAVFHWLLSALFFAAQWVNSAWLYGATMAFAIAAVYAYSESKRG